MLVHIEKRDKILDGKTLRFCNLGEMQIKNYRYENFGERQQKSPRKTKNLVTRLRLITSSLISLKRN